MEIRKLREMGGKGSAGVNIPKKYLEADGLVGPDGLKENVYVEIEHRGDGQFDLELRPIGVTD